MNKQRDWIQTYTGKKFFPLDPNPDDIDIEDIAHALSNQCRFTGHVNEFYSVAQHSVYVSEWCDPEDALWGLLHDATEAYLVDLASPMKRQPRFEAFRAAERRLERAIAKRFGLDPKLPKSVKEADKKLLVWEVRHLMAPVHPDWNEWIDLWEQSVETLRPWAPTAARYTFMNRFKELMLIRQNTLASDLAVVV